MTIKSKNEILKRLIKVNSFELKELKYIFSKNKFDFFNSKLRIGSFYNKYNYCKKDGYYINLLFNIQIENDAKRGGKSGEYIFIKNNKENREKVEFLKKLLELY